MTSTGIEIKLEVFEGPLDLLLHLIDKNKVDIYDIPIAEITDQYMEYMRGMPQENLDLVSEFLVMAATLLDIKSKMLLPAEPEEEGEEAEDPRQELVERLLEYKMYKDLSMVLSEQQKEAECLFFKPATIPEEVACYEEPVDLDALLDGITLGQLEAIFKMVIKKQEDKIDPVRNKFGKIINEPIKVSDKISYILTICKKEQRFSFRGLLEKQKNKFEVVVTFLAVLELIKVGRIRLYQEEIFGDIEMETLPMDEKDLENIDLDFQ